MALRKKSVSGIRRRKRAREQLEVEPNDDDDVYEQLEVPRFHQLLLGETASDDAAKHKFNGTMSFDPGQRGLGWAVVGYIGKDLYDYNNPKCYTIRNFGVLNIGLRGKDLTTIVNSLWELLEREEMQTYVHDLRLKKTVESQEGFDFGARHKFSFIHAMVRMGAISGMLAGMLLSVGNKVRFMPKREKWLQPVGDFQPKRKVPGNNRSMPTKKERVLFMYRILQAQQNLSMLIKLKELGEQLRPKAIEDATDAILMAMENTRKMVAATAGIWPPKNATPVSL